MSASFSTCWIVTDGHAGGLNQCIGLTDALGLVPVVKQVALRAPWLQLSPYFRLGHAYAFTEQSDKLAPPWPDLLIASGRQSVAAALYVRSESRRTGQRTVTVFIQNPGISPKHFDLVIAPEHDRVRGTNVLSTKGALHHVTRAKMDAGLAQLAPRVAHLPRPYIGVLIGGQNSAFAMGAPEMTHLAHSLKSAADATGGSLLITPSRRTGEDNVEVLKSTLSSAPVFLWDGTGDNPYFGLLGLADYLVVTSDSVSMVSEAVATGKPVYTFALPARTRRSRNIRFHESMLECGMARAFEGRLEHFDRPETPDEMTRAAGAVCALAR